MPSLGGSGNYGGDDVSGGFGNNGGLGGISGGGGGNLSDVTKAMLSSPSASQYNDYYANKLGVMGTPGNTWGDFAEDATGLMSGIGRAAYNGFLGLVDTPINFANKFGANIQTLSTPPAKPPGLGLMDPTPQEIIGAYEAEGLTPPPDVVESLARQAAALDPDKWGFFDKTVMPAMANFTGKAFTNTINPLAAVSMVEAGVPVDVLANPITQKATGFLTGNIGQSIADMAMREHTINKIMGRGIYGDDPSYGIGSISDELGEEYMQKTMPYSSQQSFQPANKYGNGYLSYGNY